MCNVLQVSKSVNELAQIMKDLSVLVIDQVNAPHLYKMDLFFFSPFFLKNEKWLRKLIFLQGTIVDRIDYNIQSVAASVEEGFKELQKVLFFLSLLLT